jgi:hypothetical protein
VKTDLIICRLARQLGILETKTNIVIKTVSSSDGNFWSRYNRWFHKDVIDLAAKINKLEVNIDQSLRANRPIIEFEAGFKNYTNFWH